MSQNGSKKKFILTRRWSTLWTQQKWIKCSRVHTCRATV